ncbi:MAG: hypothetical protein WBF90_26475 [Rivularia sp. (in: cyanobacteria)]
MKSRTAVLAAAKNQYLANQKLSILLHSNQRQTIFSIAYSSNMNNQEKNYLYSYLN